MSASGRLQPRGEATSPRFLRGGVGWAAPPPRRGGEGATGGDRHGVRVGRRWGDVCRHGGRIEPPGTAQYIVTNAKSVEEARASLGMDVARPAVFLKPSFLEISETNGVAASLETPAPPDSNRRRRLHPEEENGRRRNGCVLRGGRVSLCMHRSLCMHVKRCGLSLLMGLLDDIRSGCDFVCASSKHVKVRTFLPRSHLDRP